MISYKEALEDMVWQFAYKGTKNDKSIMSTGGLSALEYAFEALGWDDPIYFEDMDGVICDVDGCAGWVDNQGCGWREGGYWCLCGDCYGKACKGEPQPNMKERAITRENSRDENGSLPMPER